MDSSPRHPNRVLASFSPADFESVRPHLRTLELKHQTVLVRIGDRLSQIYFPHSGVISIRVCLSAGQAVSVAMIGRDSVFSALTALDDGMALTDAVVLLPGRAVKLDVVRLRAVAERSDVFRTVLARHEQVMCAEAQQSAACNASHSVEARLSRLLLRARDLSDREGLPLTQEFLAQMIGVRRNAVSIVAHAFQQAGLVSYSRGHIEIRDIDGLRRTACECYAAVRTQCDRLLNPAS